MGNICSEFSIDTSMKIDAKSDDVYSLLKNIDLLPKFIRGIEALKVNDENFVGNLSNWLIRFNDYVFKWTQCNEYDDDNKQIKFFLVDGDFEQYSGQWLIKEDAGGTNICLSVKLKVCDLPGNRDYNDINRSVNFAFRWMLRRLRKSFGSGNILGCDNLLVLDDPIISHGFSFTNSENKKIVGVHDHLRSTCHVAPIMIVVPAYGETKRDCLTIAYYLAKNGFNVFRCDLTNHVGESDGDMEFATLSGSTNDFIDIVGYIRKKYQKNKIGVVSNSLGARAVIKAATIRTDFEVLINVVAAVNVQETLNSVYAENLFEDVLQKKLCSHYDVLGHYVDSNYLVDGVEAGYYDLDSTIEDVSTIDIPQVYINAENDVWVDKKDVREVCKSSRALTESYEIKDSMHQIYENPKAVRDAMKAMTYYSLKYLTVSNVSKDDVLVPSRKELAIQNRIEKERLRSKTMRSLDDEKDFWGEYIVDFSMLRKVPEYNSFLEQVVGSYGIVTTGQKLLDAGCGVGYLGVWFLLYLQKNFLQRRSIEGQFPCVEYVGLDFVSKSLRQAKINHRFVWEKIAKQNKVDQSKLIFNYIEKNLDETLAFKSDEFDFVSSNLVISYLKNPKDAVKELVRVLKKGGVITISTLKLYADLSQIYRNFLDTTSQKQDIVEARKLLSSAGQIKQREGEGHYVFYSPQELVEILESCGVDIVYSGQTFGNQVSLAVGVKRMD